MEGMTIQRMSQQRRLLEWSEWVADCRSSGLSVNRWCREHEIQPKTYYSWQKKVFTAMVEQQQRQIGSSGKRCPEFVEIAAPEAERRISERKIATLRAGGAELDIYSGADIETVTALCKELSHAE